MKYILSALIFGLCLMGSAQAQVSVPSAQINGTCGSSSGVAFPFDWGRSAWCIHPENGNIRIKTGTLNTSPNPGNPPSPSPSSSVGWEVVSGGYWCSTMTNSTTDPRPEVDCASETGTVNFSGWYDYKQQP